MADPVKVQQQLGNMKLSNPLAAKLPPGNRGTNVELSTNMHTCAVTPNIPIYKYDFRAAVIFEKASGDKVEKELTKQCKDDFPQQERKAYMTQIYKKLTKNESAFFGKATYYDRSAILFSMNKLKSDEKVFTLPGDFIDGFPDAKNIVVTVKKCDEGYQTSTNDLARAANSRNSEADKTILEWMNVVLAQQSYMSDGFITYGNAGKTTHFLFDPSVAGFTQHDLPALDQGTYAGVGASKTVKITEGEKAVTAMVTSDVTKAPFHVDNQPLIDKIASMSVFGGKGFSVAVANQNMRQIKTQIKDLYVKTNYGKNKGRTLLIGDLTSSSNAVIECDNKQITIEQYFKKKYGVTLKHRDLFCVKEKGKDSLYPVELLYVAENQRVKKSQETPDIQAKMIRATATFPELRYGQTQKMDKQMGITVADNEYLKSAGIKINPQPVGVTGRKLPAIRLVYGGQQTVKAEKAAWDAGNFKFFGPSTVENWMVILMLSPNDERRIDANQYLRMMTDRCTQRGMTIKPPVDIVKIDRPSTMAVEKVFSTAKDRKIKYILFITSDNIKLHGYIKLQEVKSQIVTQELKASKVEEVVVKGRRQTLDNVVNKVNVKHGGLNFYAQIGTKEENAWFDDATRLIIGIEFSHPPSQRKGDAYRMPSVIGWGANIGKHTQQYIGDYMYTEPNEPDVIASRLKTMMREILFRYRGIGPEQNKATKPPPKTIIIYYSGMSEGMWPRVVNEYQSALLEMFSTLGAGFRPQLVAIACNKDHSERIYQQSISGRTAAEQNPAHGIVVDKKITNPSVSEFYLLSHSAFQGTAKVPKYGVLLNEAKLSMNEMEGMTFALCHLHEIINATISIPVPLIIADRCAKRGHDIFLAANGDGSTSSTAGEKGLDIDAANRELRNNSNEMAFKRFNA